MTSDPTDWMSIIRNLAWRIRRQHAVWNLFQALVDQGLIDVECLTFPVDLCCVRKDTQLVLELLCCFKNVRLDSELVMLGKIALQSSDYYTDIEW
jgi:hypothetical protein